MQKRGEACCMNTIYSICIVFTFGGCLGLLLIILIKHKNMYNVTSYVK